MAADLHTSSADAGPRLGVTVLSGFLGAGKTSMLTHLLRNPGGKRFAVLVNDMAEINLDAISAAEIVESREQLVSMQNGCICCTLREDLLREVARLAGEGAFDYLLVESTGISEPMPVAETFEMPVLGIGALADVARLDTMVTLVDAVNFGADLDALEALVDRGWGRDVTDYRPVSALLAEQVEFADVVVINKTDLADEAAVGRVEAAVRGLNPTARVVRTVMGRVDPREVVGSRRFSLDRAKSAPGWLVSLRGETPPETESFGVSSFVLRSSRPFHPVRLVALMASRLFRSGCGSFEGDGAPADACAKPAAGEGAEAGSAAAAPARPDAAARAASAALPEDVLPVLSGERGHVIRSKGAVWLAAAEGSPSDCLGAWSQSGQLLELEPGPPWEELRRRHGDTMEGLGAGSSSATSAPAFSRFTELVVIGVRMEAAAVEAAFRACLVTDEELRAGSAAWGSWENPIWGHLGAAEP